METFTSIVIRKKANSVWTLEDNEGGEHYSNTYSGTRENSLITIKTKTGGIIYNQQPWTIFSYIDELDGGNSFTPSSAQQLMTNLEVRDFFAEGINGGGGVNTFLELLDVLVPTFTGNGGNLIGINTEETGLIALDSDDFVQNNKGKFLGLISLSGTGAISSTEVADYYDTHTINVAADETPILGNYFRNGIIYLYQFMKGKGTWGEDGEAVIGNDFRLIDVRSLTPDDVDSDPNAVIIPLVGVVDGDFLATANLTEWDFSDSGEEQPDGGFKTYYFSYTDDGVEYFVRFIGTAGIYGGGDEPDFTAPDFTAATNSDIPPVPSLQSVTDVGATTINPIVIGTETDKITYESNRIVRSKGGNDTRITFDDPTASFSVKIRELSADEEIAFLSDILPTATTTIVLQDKGYQTISMTVTRNTGTGIEKNDICRVFLDTGEWGWYQYNGSGDTQDILNYTLIQSTTVNIV